VLTTSLPLVWSWCALEDRTYVVRLCDPWETSLNLQSLDDPQLIVDAATALGIALGATHAGQPVAQAIRGRLDRKLQAALREQADDYAAYHHALFNAFQQDQRTQRDVLAAESTVRSWLKSDRSVALRDLSMVERPGEDLH